ncbi:MULTISPECIES: flippase [Alkalimonas]|uniref:Flippase n=1 Tax=Alkalimonas mucilaginosa TaxID=3057676 RepID=A0ABU7JIZ0_9GAMM|nr:flippase [Alkalimonas sp. MEB004]MEE2025651.1 flippase [Alkalimonas sp. MEB004]
MLSKLTKILKARAVIMLGDKLVKLAAGAVLTILLARMLGAAELGVFAIVMAWSAFLVPIGSMGLNNIVVRRMQQQPSSESAMSLLYTAVALRLATALLAALVAIALFCWFYPELMQGHTAIAIPMLFVLQSFFGLLLFEFYLNYQGTFRSLALVKIAITCVSFAAKLALLIHGYGIASLIWMTSVEFLLVGLSQYLLFRRRQQPWQDSSTTWPGFSFRYVRLAQAKALLKRSSWLWLSGIVSVIYLKIDLVMLGAMAGTEQAGLYAAASRLSELWYVFPATLAARYYPDMLKAYQHSWPGYLARLRRFAGIFLAAAIVIALVMTAASHWLIPGLFGAEFTPAIAVLQIHIWAGCFIFVRYLISQHLVITEQEPLSLLSHGIAALLNVGLNWWLIPIMGIQGAAWATLIAYAYASFFFLFFSATTRKQLWQVLNKRAVATAKDLE